MVSAKVIDLCALRFQELSSRRQTPDSCGKLCLPTWSLEALASGKIATSCPSLVSDSGQSSKVHEILPSVIKENSWLKGCSCPSVAAAVVIGDMLPLEAKQKRHHSAPPSSLHQTARSLWPRLATQTSVASSETLNPRSTKKSFGTFSFSQRILLQRRNHLQWVGGTRTNRGPGHGPAVEMPQSSPPSPSGQTRLDTDTATIHLFHSH